MMMRQMARARRARSGVRTALGLALAAAMIVPALPAGAAAPGQGITRVISLHTNGTTGNRHSGSLEFSPSDSQPAITPDARYVAFSSEAFTLVNSPGGEQEDLDDVADVFVRDRDRDADLIMDEPDAVDTELVSRATPSLTVPPGHPFGALTTFEKQLGVQMNPAVWPAISSNGRYVAFAALTGKGTVPSDTPGGPPVGITYFEIWVRDRDVDGNGIYDEPSIDTDVSGVIEAAELRTKTVKVSVKSDGSLPAASKNLAFSAPSISATGRYVSYATTGVLSASDTALCGGLSCADVYVHDRDSDGNGIFDEVGGIATTLVSTGTDGVGNGHSGMAPPALQNKAPSISDDGRFVAFDSFASNLAPGDTNNNRDVFVADRQAGTVQRISGGPGTAQSWMPSWGPVIAGDSSKVAFMSQATTLLSSDTSTDTDIYIWNRADGVLSIGTLTNSGGNANGTNPSLSQNGRYLGFESGSQVYVRDLVNNTRKVASISPRGETGAAVYPPCCVNVNKSYTDGVSHSIAVANNGWSAFYSKAWNLDLDHSNQCVYPRGSLGVTGTQVRECADVFVRYPGLGCLSDDPATCLFNDNA